MFYYFAGLDANKPTKPAISTEEIIPSPLEDNPKVTPPTTTKTNMELNQNYSKVTESALNPMFSPGNSDTIKAAPPKVRGPAWLAFTNKNNGKLASAKSDEKISGTSETDKLKQVLLFNNI